MSDHYIALVPVDPHYVPTAQQVRDAETAARSLFPQADGISSQLTDGIRLFDAGDNFESVTCPGCGSRLELEWWQEAMDADFGGQGFRLQPQTLPCCNRSFALNQLTYDWPQAFGRFGLEILNPNEGAFPTGAAARIEAALGNSLNLIYSHR